MHALDKLRHLAEIIRSHGVPSRSLGREGIDLLAEVEGCEVFLCGRYGEAEVRYWHPADAGFGGRRPL